MVLSDYPGYHLTITANLLVQAMSAVLIGWLLLYYASIYRRKYMSYWSWSFFSLAVFLLGSALSMYLLAAGFTASSPWRLSNLFITTTAGYMQIGFLVIGTISLVNGTQITHRHLIKIITTCLLIALAVTVYKNWAVDAATLRYFTRVGLRYFIAGLACIGTAIYILRNDPNPIIGKKIVTIGFFTYGFEMTFLGWLTIENHFLGGSYLLGLLVPYHGLFELILYPMIGVGLVVWLLEIERIESQNAHERLHQMNLTDSLTGLPNQEAMNAYIKRWKKASSASSHLTLALLGVDQMSRFYQAEGLKKGDQLLLELGKRLDMLCKGLPFYGRIYGDVFVILIHGFSPSTLEKINKIRKQSSRAFKLDGKTYHLEFSAGVADLAVDMNPEDAFNQANMALQSAKQSGGKRVTQYHAGMQSLGRGDLSFENELRQALKHNAFTLYYQPIWTSTNQISGFEALIRWQHPQRGLLTPDEFLPLVQQLGLMVELDYWVADQAFKQIKSWRKSNPDAAKININISAETIQSGELIEHLKACSLKHQVTAQYLTVEITENTVMNHVERGTRILKELQQMGIKIAIDDFGTGYSSLNYLRTFSADVIKFDRSFIDEHQRQRVNREILKAMIPLCHQIGKQVVVEGIETKAQFEFCEGLNVDAYQGFYLSQPVTAEKASRLLVMSKKRVSNLI